MNVTCIGIDLAKNVFSLHGVDAHGKTVLKKTVSRAKLMGVFANLPPCIVGMEACSGAHHWARQLVALGFDARIIAPRFVIPYRKSGKNDGNDAEAICEAVSRPAMRFVQINQQILAYDREIEALARHSATALRLMTIPGIGAITATALVASIGNPQQFHSGRQLAA